MSRFLDKRHESLEAYIPGEQPQDKKYIKLNTNESPYPPSEAVVNAITADEVRDLRLYSDPLCKKLTAKLASLYDVEPENIFITNGSDDSLNFAFMAFAGKDTDAAFADITYGFYPVYADLHHINYREIPLKADFTIDVEAFCNTGCFTVIANPNAPTGLMLTTEDIERIIESNPDNVVLIDEAYIDFGGQSVAPLIKKYKNLLVVQTFSKSRCLAGARLGFAVGDRELIEDLQKLKFSTNPYCINRLTLLAGEAAIDTNDYYMERAEKIIETRAFTQNALKELGFNVIPSYTNFVFAKHDKIGGEELYLRLKDEGILVRHFTGERIKEYNRITIGTREQMEIFIETTKRILAEV